MLNIPDSVKDLFKLDNVKKNFRVHFPNGEHADLTNSDIVSESVSFTESLCSRDKLTFGLCESPNISFKTIGVDNIRTYCIECSIEIDVSSLPELPEGAQTSDDVEFPFYRVPYGVFYVDRCDRELGSEVRSITAYGQQAYAEWGPTPNELWRRKKWQYYPSNKAYKSNLEGYIRQQINQKGLAEKIAHEKGILVNFPDNDQYGTYRGALEITLYGPNVKGGNLTIRTKRYHIPADINKYYAILYDETKYKEAYQKYEELKEELKEYAVLFFDLHPNVKNKNEIMNKFFKAMDNFTFSHALALDGGGTLSVTSSNQWTYYSFTNTIDDANHCIKKGFIYPYVIVKPDSGMYYNIDVPYEMSVSINEHKETFNIDIDAKLYEITPDSTITFTAPTVNNIKDSDYEHIGEATEAYCELSGLIGHFGRDGEFEMIKLDNNFLRPADGSQPAEDFTPHGSAYNVDRRFINKLMVKDNKSLPYDRVSMTYTNTSGEDVYIYKDIVDTEADDYDAQNYQSYTLGRNWIVQNKQLTAEQAQNILGEVAENIKDVQYTPLQMTMKGLPFIESGDYITATYDGESFETYVLAHTIKGVQNLTDTITSY